MYTFQFVQTQFKRIIGRAHNANTTTNYVKKLKQSKPVKKQRQDTNQKQEVDIALPVQAKMWRGYKDPNDIFNLHVCTK